MDKISIIVPVYNVEAYLHECVDSILKQKYRNIEIILVDDGSTDGSGYICDEYSKKDSRVKTIHKENGGLSDARNVGIDYASGSYLAFIDSDDYILPNMLNTLFEQITKNNADIALCLYCTNLESRTVSKNNTFVMTPHEAILDLIGGKASWYVPVWNKLYKKELFDNIRFPLGRNAEDVSTTYRLFYASKRIVCTDQKLYIYRVRQEGLSKTKNYRMEDSLLALRERSSFFFENNELELFKRSEDAYLRMIIWFYVRISEKEILCDLQNEYIAKYRKNESGYNLYEKVVFRIFYFFPHLYKFIWHMLKKGE